MKMDVRTSVALCLVMATATAAAQQPDQSPFPAFPAQPSSPPPAPATPPPAPPVQQQPGGVPQSPPPARYPVSPQYPQQYQYTTPQNPPPPANPPPPKPEWTHSETSYAQGGFQYHPFRLHIDGGATIPVQSNANNFQSGWNAGLGFSWFPAAHLPLGLRVDGTYNEFVGTNAFLSQATSTYGTQITSATAKMYGGDADLELDLQITPYIREYFVAGGGWYRQQFTYRQTNYYPGFICVWYGCGPGYYGVTSVVAHTTGDWHFAKNAGIGFEFAMGPRTSFFVEARYMRLDPSNTKSYFVPIRAGLRF